MKTGEWFYLCVAHGNDGAMEVCFVHITTSSLDLISLWKALLRYRLHFTYRRQRNCFVKLTTHFSFQVLHSPVFTHCITYTFFSPDFKSPSRLILDTFPHYPVVWDVSLHMPTSTIVKHLNTLKLNPLFMPFFWP